LALCILPLEIDNRSNKNDNQYSKNYRNDGSCGITTIALGFIRQINRLSWISFAIYINSLTALLLFSFYSV